MNAPKVDVLQKRRTRSAIECAKKLRAAASAVSAYLRACNELRDGSESLRLQGKGIDSRETMIRDLSEYAGYLESKYGANS